MSDNGFATELQNLVCGGLMTVAKREISKLNRNVVNLKPVPT